MFPSGSVSSRTCGCCLTPPACRCRPSPRTPSQTTRWTRTPRTPTSDCPVSPTVAPQPSAGAPPLRNQLHSSGEPCSVLHAHTLFFPVRATDKRIACDEELSDSEDEGEGGRKNVASHKKGVKRARVEDDKKEGEEKKAGELEVETDWGGLGPSPVWSVIVGRLTFWQRSRRKRRPMRSAVRRATPPKRKCHQLPVGGVWSHSICCTV